MGLKLLKGLVFLLLTGLGILGNVSVFVHYMCNIEESTEKKSVQFILIHVVFTNIIMLLSKGLQRTVATLGSRNFLDDLNCMSVTYLERVSRGLSIFTSSLLTVVQASTISPRASLWRRIKPRSTWCILPLLLFFWILNSFISMSLLNSIRNTSLLGSQFGGSEYYCYVLPGSQKINSIFLTFMAVRDALSQSVMAVSSGYMIFLLRKHHQHVLYFRNSKFLYKTPAEMKAAHSVLLLMLCFLCFYWTDCLISLYLAISLQSNSILIIIQEFLTLGYAILSPFVLIHRAGHLAACWLAHWRERH
ncbi:putative vomeronasal receptor-like protein 4 [Perognathus longimembris pacificus]|uniref:putative vomeronasal receptor-like protein 4 n=1 Tax=Perognathus longimembris pacificus TaxID=214514 RepID=UPI0020187BBB|nr:putative vomeronasal receptor-like protein 4 [Perognathus longimembris pacificus]